MESFLADGSRVALVDDLSQIWLYSLESNLDGQTWMHDNGRDIIEVDDISDLDKVYLRFALSDDSTLLFTELNSNFVKAFRQTSPDVAWTQLGQDIQKAPFSSSISISSNGNRIALRTYSTDTNSISNSDQDEVQILDYNGTEWHPVGNPIMKSGSSLESQGFGYSIDMSPDGNSLLVGLNHQDCRPNYLFFEYNTFDIDKCTKSSRALFELFTYDPLKNQFIPAVSRENVEDTHNVISDGNILYGLHFSMSNGSNDSTLLSVSNYNIDNRVVLIDVIDLDEMFYMKCVVENPKDIGNGDCLDFPPYYTPECGFDGGDCDRNPVDGYPDCLVHNPQYIENGYCNNYPPYNTKQCGYDGGDCIADGYPDCSNVGIPYLIGNKNCQDYPPYNTKQCGYDGGDCVPVPVDGYPDCLLPPGNHDLLNDEYCNDEPPFNTEACGFDGGACILKPVDGYPDYLLLPQDHDSINDEYCDDEPPYNTEACGFDGGACIPKPVDGYPDCLLLPQDHDSINDEYCDDEPPYNTEACGFDGGACIPKPVDGYPDCLDLLEDHWWIGNGYCDDEPPYNTEACGFDGRDCERNPVDGHPDCLVHNPSLINDGSCNYYPPYNTEACGFDGGDCVSVPVDGYPDCLVLLEDHWWIGNGYCNEDLPYNTEACGFDGGDCERNPVDGHPDCLVHNTSLINDGSCDYSPPYNTEACGFDGGDCL